MANNKKTNKAKKEFKSNTNAKTTFEKVVQKNIYTLVDELKKTQNLYRASDIVNLIQVYYEYAHINKLNIDYPKGAEFEVNKYDFTKIEGRNNYIYNYYNLTLANDFNKKMCEINSHIFIYCNFDISSENFWITSFALSLSIASSIFASISFSF